MKVIKRDGRAVEYNRDKIIIAINKANNEVLQNEKAQTEDIFKIIEHIESLDKKRILVEDIQDIIEQQLMELKKYSLAKKYIVYRYTRALIRKQNTTDESILGIIKNNNINKSGMLSNIASQRNYITSEVSYDLTKRLLLPEKLNLAEEEGILHFHNANYFIQPMIKSSTINLQDMLQNGTKINNYIVNKVESFNDACTITSLIILDVANNQYGIQTIDLSCLGKYLAQNNKELKDGIEILKQHLLAMLTIHGNLIKVRFTINLDENSAFLNENKLIYNELLNSNIVDNINIILEKNIKVIQGEFNQGKVSINLAQIAIKSNKNIEIFYLNLKEKLELCKEALMYRHYALLETSSKVSPILWNYGGIARLDENEKINYLLKNGLSTLTLGYVGMEEVINFFNTNINKEDIIDLLEKTIDDWKNETGIKFEISDNVSKKVKKVFLEKDKENFGLITSVTDKENYV